MKRLLTLTLVFFMALSCGIINANAADDYGKENTFFMSTYTGIDYGFENSVPSVPILYDDIRDKGVKAAAKDVVSKLNAQPEGRRVLNINSCTNLIWTYDILDDLDFSKIGEEKLGPMFDELFKELKALGAEIDFVSDDNEGGRSVYEFENIAIMAYMKGGENTVETIAKNGHLYEEHIKNQLLEIENHPQYQAVLRPLLEENGFVFGEEYDLYYLNVFPGAQEPRKSKFYEKEQPEGAENSNNVYSMVMKELAGKAYKKYVVDNILKYYPDCQVSNYEAFFWMDGKYPWSDANGNRYNYDFSSDREVVMLGNASSYVAYGELGSIINNPPVEYPYETMKETGFNTLLYMQKKMENGLMAEEKYGFKSMPWVWTKTGGPEIWYNNYYSGYYWDEAMFHILLKNPLMLQVFDVGSKGTMGVAGDIEYLSNLMYEVDELCGYEDRKAIVPTMQSWTKWDQRYILSGMYAGGKNVWRITPDLYTPGVDIDNFCTNTSKPTFQIGNQIVEFPQGSYIYEIDGALSDYGYWVISPEGTQPRQYRDESKPEPDEPVETADRVPTGFKEPITGNGKKSPLIDRSYEEKAPVSDNNDNEDNNQQSSDNNVQPSISISVNPVSFSGKRTEAITGKLPQDAVGHWAENTLANMFALGVMKGSNIGMEPDSQLNRAEFITMLFRLFGVTEQKYDGSISDVADDAWYADTIYTAVSGGIISADDGKANPEAPLSRGETMVIFVKLTSSILPETDSANVKFADEDSLDIAELAAVKKAVALGIIEGYPDGTFKPENILTRAEAACIIERYLRV